MTPRHDYQFGDVAKQESTNVTRGIELHRFIDDKRTAKVLVKMGFGYLAGAFDPNYQNK